MQTEDEGRTDELLRWCRSVLDPFEDVTDHSRDHPGQRTSTYRLKTSAEDYYLKAFSDPASWHCEVHAYERWAPAFGSFSPRLLAVRDVPPLACVISSLPGRILEGSILPAAQEQAVWRSAGQALSSLHNLPSGQFFGACHRDGTCAGSPISDAREYISRDFNDLLSREKPRNLLAKDELAVIQTAIELIPMFAGEQPRPCHRDYGPANWLITPQGAWAGVIDFEFSAWDVRVADFARYPEWNWIYRPELLEVFFEGYGRCLSPQESQQCWVARVQYALTAVVWGEEHEYHGFAREGRLALQYLARQLTHL